MPSSEMDPSLPALPAVPDPERWSDRAQGEVSIEDAIGGAMARVRDAMLPEAPAITWKATAPLEPRSASRSVLSVLSWRFALVAGSVVVLATSGAVAAARLVLGPPRRSQQTIQVPAAATVVVTGSRRRRLTITGPARVELEPAAAARSDVAVAGGRLVAEAGDLPLSVRAGDLLILVRPEGTGEIDGREGREPEVRALAGEVRVRSGDRPEASLRAAPVTPSPAPPSSLPSPLPVPSLTAPSPSSSPPALSSSPPALSSSPPALSSSPPALSSSPPSPSSSPPSPSSPRATAHRRVIAKRAAVVVSPPSSPPSPLPPSPSLSPLLEPPPYAAGRTAQKGNQEGELLAGAFQALRSRRDPRAALAALDDYQRRFPDGSLRAEARLARVEALLALGRAPEALPLLLGPGAESDDIAATPEVRLVRAELLARAGRCSEATRDFDLLLTSGGGGDAAGERALYGRASCRLRTGDRDGARDDLERYLAAYPRGARRPAVVRSLNLLRQR